MVFVPYGSCICHVILCRILSRAGEVLVGRLEIVFLRGHLGIANRCRCYVQWEGFSQFHLTGASEVLEQPGPRFEPGLADDPLQLRPEIDVALPVSRNDPLGAGPVHRLAASIPRPGLSRRGGVRCGLWMLLDLLALMHASTALGYLCSPAARIRCGRSNAS